MFLLIIYGDYDQILIQKTYKNKTTAQKKYKMWVSDLKKPTKYKIYEISTPKNT